MRRSSYHPPRGGDQNVRHDLSPSRGYGSYYNHPPKEFRHRDEPPNNYPSRSHYEYGHNRPLSSRGYRGPPGPGDDRYYDGKHPSDRWRSQNDHRRGQGGYYDRPRPRHPEDREYSGRNYDYERRHGYEDHPTKYSSRSRGPSDGYYKKPASYGYRDSVSNDCKIFVGNIHLDTTSDELKEIFGKCGELIKCDMRKRFAFIEFNTPEAATQAITNLDGHNLHGEPIKVKPHTEHSNKNRDRFPIPRRRPGYAVTVANIEETTSWQDLKDFGRLAGEVTYASIVIKDGKKFGVIEYLAPESVKNALVELQGKQISNNKLDIIEGSIIGTKSTNNNDNIDDDDDDSPNNKRFRDDKDFDDEAQVDYKSE